MKNGGKVNESLPSRKNCLATFLPVFFYVLNLYAAEVDLTFRHFQVNEVRIKCWWCRLNKFSLHLKFLSMCQNLKLTHCYGVKYLISMKLNPEIGIIIVKVIYQERHLVTIEI